MEKEFASLLEQINKFYAQFQLLLLLLFLWTKLPQILTEEREKMRRISVWAEIITF